MQRGPPAERIFCSPFLSALSFSVSGNRLCATKEIKTLRLGDYEIILFVGHLDEFLALIQSTMRESNGALTLTANVLRNLSDRQYEKRKLAATEIEARIRELVSGAGDGRDDEVDRILRCLGRDYAQSSQANNRKGGLIGLAAAALGLGNEAHRWLHQLLPPLLSCFTDQDSRVRYYACESLYNIAKVTRTRLLAYFNQVFDALCRISADLDPNVKNGAQLLDSLLKDIVADSTIFPLENFVPVLRQHLENSSSYLRHLLIGWIVALDAIAHADMQAHLKHVLPGIFAMLGDDDPEIKQQADHMLAHFLQRLESGPAKHQQDVIEVVIQCGHIAHANSERAEAARVATMRWLVALIKSAHRDILPYSGNIIGLILVAANHQHTDATLDAGNEMEEEMRALMTAAYASEAKADTTATGTVQGDLGSGRRRAEAMGRPVDVVMVVECIAASLRVQHMPSPRPDEHEQHVANGRTAARLKALKWLDIVVDLIQEEDAEVMLKVVPIVIKEMIHPEPQIGKAAVGAMCKMALKSNDLAAFAGAIDGAADAGDAMDQGRGVAAAAALRPLLPEILRQMLESLGQLPGLVEERGGAIIKELCVLLGSEPVFLHLADALEGGAERTALAQQNSSDVKDLEQWNTMASALVDKLTMVMLTVTEVADIRAQLMQHHQSLVTPQASAIDRPIRHPAAGPKEAPADSLAAAKRRLLEWTRRELIIDARRGTLFEALYAAWRPYPASALCLCLLAGEYHRASDLVSCIATLLRQLPPERTLAVLVQLDKLVQLIESPAFASLRLQLLSPHHHPYLVKSLYGILMLLPQRCVALRACPRGLGGLGVHARAGQQLVCCEVLMLAL